MRAAVITRHGPPQVLQVQERPDPSPPRPGEALIEVRAAGVNFADLMARVGLYPDAPKPPCVVGYEITGTISAVGEGVEGFAVGDRVIAATNFGGYAERVVSPVANLLALPRRLSFEEGAAIPVNYATAHVALVRYGALEAGQRVLVHAAAGGVGIAATQIAKSIGAEVWGSASPGKHEAIRSFGVDHAIDYTRAGWERDVPPLDVVMDALGGVSFRRSYELLGAGGRLICFGASGVVSGERRNLIAAARTALRMPRFNLIKQMSESKAVIGLNLLTLWKQAGSIEPYALPLRSLLDDGTIRPVVAETFPLERAGDAHRFITERRNVGKVVLVP
ncbi:MAG: synaptic vesicle VAT-1 family membrane protein [Solirubrobacteraceae bacterium]|nr:MAG: oxidoreductase [Solirubrobacterales bacterium]